MRPVKYTEGKTEVDYTYDNAGRVTSEVVKEGEKILSQKSYTYEYNSTGLKTTETINGDSSSDTITNIVQQDILGRNVLSQRGDTATSYQYDMLNNVIGETLYSGSSTFSTKSYVCDYRGNVFSSTTTDGSNSSNKITTSATYDRLGRMTSSTDPKGNTTEYSYNGLGLVTQKKVPFDGDNYTTYSYTYDKVGNVIRESVTGGATNTYTYDYRNNVTTATKGGQSVKYTYDNVGNMIKYTVGDEENCSVHSYEYDGLNRLVKYTDALGNSETYTYDDNQDMVKKVDRNGNIINYTYDGLHRMTSEKTNGVDNSWTYGLTGGIIEERNNNAVKTYTYNNMGLQSKDYVEIGNTTYYIARTYDGKGNNTINRLYKDNDSISDTLISEIKYEYDYLNRLTKVYDANNSSTGTKASYIYDANSNNTQIVYGNNAQTVYNYNDGNMVTSVVNKYGNTVYTSSQYTYRADGNILTKAETIGNLSQNVAYTYDTSGRLSKESYTGSEVYSVDYTYDQKGNRTTAFYSGEDIASHTENYTYDLNNRLVKILDEYVYGSNYTTDFVYDNNGNQLREDKYPTNKTGEFQINITDSRAINGNAYSREFTYNGLNQLVGYRNSNGSYNGKTGLTAEYKYMANGYRLSKSVNGKETKYLWDGDNITAELNSLNVITNKYYRGINLICDSSNTYYLHNAHGDVIATLNGTTLNGNYLYSAFGKTEDFGAFNTTDMWGYCDQLYDFETGNYYMRARYYNPNTGRFISEDPIKDGINWYSYCYNNPVVGIDPNGEMPEWLNEVFDGVKNFADGVISGIAESVTFGFSNVSGKYIQPDDEKLYYAGKVVGNAISMIGSATGALAASGATLLVTSTGQIYVSVPAATAATACAGLTTSSAANMLGNVAKFSSNSFSTQNRGTNNVRVMQKTKIKGYEVSVDLEKGGSGVNNIHAEVDGKKYYLDEETKVFLDKNGNRLPNKLRGNKDISNAVNKANKLIAQGW